MHRRHRRVDVVLECLLDAAGERRQHEHRLEVLLVQDLHPRVAVLVLGMIRQPVDLHQRRRVDALGDLAAEQQVQAARLDDRIERRVRDEVVDPLTHHGQRALAVGDHLHAAALELLGQVAGARVDRLVVVVVDVDRHVVQCHACPFGSPFRSFSWREVGRPLLEELGDALDEVGALHRLVHQLLGVVARLEHIAHGVCVHLLLDHRQRTGRAVGGDVLGVGDRARQQVVGRHDLLDESERRGLVGEEHPAGQQQVQRGAPADDARQNPRDAVLRDQTATRERRGELGAFGGEPDVAHQRLGQPDTRAGAVDRGDDRLAQRRHEVRMPLADHLGDVGLAVGVDVARRSRSGRPCRRPRRTPGRLPVTTMARTSGSASAVVEQCIEPGREAAAPTVHPLGPIERQHRHAAVAELVEHRVAAGRTGSATRSGTLTRQTSSGVRARCMHILYTYR